jgi:hypothetical protein
MSQLLIWSKVVSILTAQDEQSGTTFMTGMTGVSPIGTL